MIKKRLQKLEGALHDARPAWLFVDTLAALRSEDPARIEAVRLEVARAEDGALVNLCRAMLRARP